MSGFTRGVGRVLVHKAIVGATLGGLLTTVAVAVVGHPVGSERFVVSSLLQVVATLAIMGAVVRPGAPRPLTWARAMLGAVVVSGLSLLVFGLVPHEFITYVGSELQWDRRDLIMIDLPVLPFDISRQAGRDIIAAGLYTNSFAAALALWLMWQRRYELAGERERAQEPVPVPAGTSAYGRPVSKQA